MTLAFEHAFRLGERRVSAEVVEQVLSRAIDELARLRGFDPKKSDIITYNVL